MSHYTVLVGLTQKEYEAHVKDFEVALDPKYGWQYSDQFGTDIIDGMLAPFDENMSVRAYETECHCVGWQAKIDAMNNARDILNWEWDEQREVFHREMDEMGIDRNERQSFWQDHIKPYEQKEAELLDAHPLKGKPDPDCTDCNGTGTHLTTSNPQSKWDWYSIGGRWGNTLSEYEPKNDPNAATGRELADNAYIPFAILVRDKFGELRWSQRGEMGWFAMVSNENDNWDAIANELLRQFEDHVFVLVDCHI